MIIFKDRILSKQDEKEQAIIEIAYAKYIHNWLESHGRSLLDVIDKLEEIRQVQPYIADIPIAELYDAFLYEIGFDSNIYDTKDEFLDEEFRDEEYMKELLTDDEYKIYKTIITKETDE